MGGPGSGYHSWRRLPRNLVERAFMLDLAALHRVREATGTITTGQLVLVARATGEELPMRYTANLTDLANPHLELTFKAAGRWHHQVICLDVDPPSVRRLALLAPVPCLGSTHALPLPAGRRDRVRLAGGPWPELPQPVRERLLAQRQAGAEDSGAARGRRVDLRPLPDPAAWHA